MIATAQFSASAKKKKDEPDRKNVEEFNEQNRSCEKTNSHIRITGLNIENNFDENVQKMQKVSMGELNVDCVNEKIRAEEI